ncbi:hypothetical protein T07_7723 [Trichinella nelsoni]|uniref:Uncharacterized protein n=1 Tax=Trichinella nelsoni TaxID=6336 RepID=A0A0V0SJ28_9BILA|nr:hypothetical protein T07_7723 [Trichinella nelsoni]
MAFKLLFFTYCKSLATCNLLKPLLNTNSNFYQFVYFLCSESLLPHPEFISKEFMNISMMQANMLWRCFNWRSELALSMLNLYKNKLLSIT